MSLLERILGAPPTAFALLHRPATTGPDRLDVLVGDVSLPPSLADIPLRGDHETLVVIPYRQITERGYACVDDGSPLIALTVGEHDTVPVAEALRRLPRQATPLTGGRFDVDDATYARTVRRIINEVIGEGEGANFVIRRSFVADIGDYGPTSALAVFRRLLQRESGAYWTFLVHTGFRTFVGASPERHISVHDGMAVMNPISGTYRYPATGPTLPGVMDFLADRKEAEELYMVVDEELKMMARVCATGGRVVGPYLKEMARLAHTEYFIEGRTTRDVRDILRETMFAPTVTGSPLESACRVIAQYEGTGRGYYSGVAALIGPEERGGRTLDSAILIRTADIDSGGRMRIGVGATLVRHSDPDSEVAETRAKAAGLLSALEEGDTTSFARRPEVRAALERRNDGVAGFWLRDGARDGPLPDLLGRTALVVDAEDTFTSMMEHQLRALGLDVAVRRFDQDLTLDGHHLVVMGPGPGDPTENGHPKMERLRCAIRELLARRRPFLAVCLSHQVLSLELGLPVRRRAEPNQGVQKEIDLFGRRERVGFYNTFAARSRHNRTDIDGVGTVRICRDPETGEVHALRGPRFASIQFHPESLLTQDGPGIIARAVRHALS